MATVEKKIPDWTIVRDTVDKISDEESKNTLRVSYLFGTSLQEIVRGRHRKITLKGNDFFTEPIEGEEALILKLPTARRGYKPRYVAVPLNPKSEPWAEKILKYSEEKADNYVYRKVNREIQYGIQRKYFINYEWPPTWYENKKGMHINRIPFRHKHLSEIREWELGLCNNFTEFDFNHFFGKYYNSDYIVYFKKLLNKTDYYETEDITNSIILKNRVFSQARSRYDFKVFMKIQKMLKRNYIGKLPSTMFDVNKSIDISSIPKLSGKHHRILQANIKEYLERNSDQVVCEDSNLDVIDLVNGTVVECGHTEASKLLDSFNGVFSGIGDIKQFWILSFYDEEDTKSACHKFVKTDKYR